MTMPAGDRSAKLSAMYDHDRRDVSVSEEDDDHLISSPTVSAPWWMKPDVAGDLNDQVKRLSEEMPNDSLLKVGDNRNVLVEKLAQEKYASVKDVLEWRAHAWP